MRTLGLIALVACTAGTSPAVARDVVPVPRGSDPIMDTLPGQTLTGTHTFGAATRAYHLYVPSGASSASAAPRAMLVLLHGCTQDADDALRGTRVRQYAERAGMLVLAPEQTVNAHPQKCWNWYVPAHQQRDAGEPALLASMIAELARQHGADTSRVHIAGMSAGGAMAQLLVTAYPERYASLTVASGVPVGAASTIPDALAAMRDGPREGRVSAAIVQERMGARSRAVPMLVMHGAMDAVVSPRNADALVSQWRELLATQGLGLARSVVDNAGGEQLDWRDAQGALWLRAWRISNVGHAWSGGDSSGTYVDAAGPDATAALFDFIASAFRGQEQ